jgi:hypothetical protein
MDMCIQNRSDLYKILAPLDNPAIVPQGIHPARLIEVRRFNNSFGERVGLVFEITGGTHRGAQVMESATLKNNPRSKLADLLRGIGGGGEVELLAANDLIGRDCKILIKHEQNRQGKSYAAVSQTFP